MVIQLAKIPKEEKGNKEREPSEVPRSKVVRRCGDVGTWICGDVRENVGFLRQAQITPDLSGI